MARKRLGKYEIIDRIGRGGMAEVYRGYHASLDRYVAIKLLHPFLADDPEFKDRFENEARNVAKLKHPNIVQVYDFEYDGEGESYYMVMELINGPTLKDRLFEIANSGEKITVAEAIRIVKSAAEALAYAHQRSMIHRDVKPANLMLDEDDRVVLTDFGIAKIVTGAQFTASGGMVGTPAYMAPEQGLGEAGDERSDIYSLGVILFQLVVGRLPFDAETPLAIILKHLNEPLPAPHEFVPDIPEDLEKVICRSLAKDADDRYSTAAEFAQDLNRLDGYGRRQPQFDTPTGLKFSTTEMPQQSITMAPEATLPAPPDRPTLPESPMVASGRLRLTWVLGIVAVVVLITALALIGFTNRNNNNNGNRSTNTVNGSTNPSIAMVTEEPSETLEAITPTDTPTTMPTITDTPEPTDMPTITPSPTFTDTPEPTDSPTPDLTATAAFAFYLTEIAKSPTPNMTQTIAACDFEYIVTTPERHDIAPRTNETGNPRLVRSGTDFSFDVIFNNTGSCVWPDGVRLVYNPELTLNPILSENQSFLSEWQRFQDACADQELRPGVNFAFQERSNFRIPGEVGIEQDSAPLTFEATAPNVYGCYYSVWDLIYPGSSDVTIGRPLLIAIRAWGSS